MDQSHQKNNPFIHGMFINSDNKTIPTSLRILEEDPKLYNPFKIDLKQKSWL